MVMKQEPSSPQGSQWPSGSEEGSEPLAAAGLPTMFEHLFRRQFSMADFRRRTLTLIDVVVEQHMQGPLVAGRLCIAAVVAVVYLYWALPRVLHFGQERWQAEVDAGLVVPSIGGFYAEVSWAYVTTLSISYFSLVYLGVRRMERRPPLQRYVFEAIAVYNCLQCLLNACNCCALVLEARQLGLHVWGNCPDHSAEGGRLASLIWLQYHSRQLQLFETFFMVLRKRFHRISLLHLYLHVLNLWGWFFACRFACGGDTYVSAIVTSACQALLYFYFSLSLLGWRDVPFFRKALITEVQLLQYVLCALHNIGVAAYGLLPRSLAVLHLFVIGNGLVLYTDFHYEGDYGERASKERKKKASAGAPGASPPSQKGARVTFSFDSCGWLYCYHFGVAHWLHQHLMPGVTSESVMKGEFPPGLAFSGSSGGALVSTALATGVDLLELFTYVLEQHEACRRNPRRMFPAAEQALRKFEVPGVCKHIAGRLRVLLTRVSPFPPFVMGEVVDRFPDNETCIATLVASCHVPFFAGILPRRVGNCYYYDGMMWTATLVPWRGSWGDRVVKVSSRGAPLSHIQAPVMPVWWMVLPPSIDVLRGMFWCGYRDAALYFGHQPVPHSLDCCVGRRSACDQAVQTGKASGRTVASMSGGKDASASPLDRSLASVKDIAVYDGLRTWEAARSLLKKAPRPAGEELPETDPVTGQKVQKLLADFHVALERENRRMRFVAAIVVPAAVAITWSSLRV